MSNYRYKAINERGKIFRGTIFAVNETDAEKRLRKDGLTLITSKRLEVNYLSGLFAKAKVKPRLIIEFYYRLSQTLNLGLPILTALDENAKALPSKSLKKIIGEIGVTVESGNTLYESMAKFPKTFQKLDIGIIKMGEQSGVLPKCLKELADFLEWKEDIRSTIKRAAMYPIFVILILTAVIGVWVGYVLPMMANVLQEMGVALPGITQTILSISLFIKENWIMIISGILILITAVYLFQKSKKGKILCHQYILKTPIFGDIILNIALARLCRNFATMQRSGIMLSSIFEILTDNVIGNRFLENRLQSVFQEIERGQSIAAGFENAEAFPPLVLGAIRNGEMTGTLDEAFERLGHYYDIEVKRSVQTMISAIEPMTLILLGGIFGLIVLSIMLPLYDVIGDLGKAY
ncbi:MAG: type II secretion system F family protein [Desulfobacteraceae bacterium]|nr:type II secretion system F family protein [Pseudomonadota bacterium]MCG2755676.1 type II secretion system F family protein [Desulfobacteraceae bacterium]